MKPGPPRLLALSRAILAQGVSLRCQTLGSSMFPFISTGSVIRISPAPADALRPGDIIVYQQGEAVIAHRLIRKGLDQGKIRLFTRGDAFPRKAVEEVAPEQVLGRVVAVEWRRGRQMRLDAGRGRALGIFLSKIAPLSLCVYCALSRIKQLLGPP